MKHTLKLWIVVFGMLMLGNVANAETPREQLKQMVEQLQKTPTDDALREKIIKLAQELKPAPAVPEEAERRMMRGTAAYKGAESVADYRDAAKEFEQATLAAPWVGEAYLNLGVVQDKAEDYEAALRSLKLALLALPNDKEIKALIYEVEYRNEKANLERKKQEDRLHTTEGLWQAQYNGRPSGNVYEVKQDKGRFDLQYLGADPTIKYCGSNYYNATATSIEFKLTGSDAGSTVCGANAYNIVQCHLSRETTLDCHSYMFVDGKKAKNGYGEYISNDFIMIRKTSCKNFRHEAYTGGSADCE